MHDVVAHLLDGRVLKGTTANFRPQAPEFHLHGRDDAAIVAVRVADLKGLFFVHDFEGDPERRGRDDAERAGLGRKVEVVFVDGETMLGYTAGYAPGRPSFWVTPADPTSNNDRVFVVTAATTSVRFVD
jgi:hypothetical protein